MEQKFKLITLDVNRLLGCYHHTGAKLIKDGKIFMIPRENQHSQAHKAGLDFDGTSLLSMMPGE